MTMQSKPLTGTRLSPQQRHLWALMTELGQGAFTTWAMLRIDGELEPGRLAAAFAATIERHEVLRTTFHALPGMTIPLQVVQPAARFSLLRPEARQADEELLLAACREPFDLAAGPVLRAALVSPGPGRHLLGVALPAVASDGPGLINLLREVVDAYGRQDGPPADEGPLQYADIAEWQNEVFEGEGGSVGAQRWSSPDLQEALAAEVVLPGLRTPAAGFSPCVLRVALAAGTADRIAAAARRLAVPEQAVLLAVWQALLGRLAGSDRVVVGVLADGRAYAELGEALGALARHLPIVGRSAPGGSLASRAGEAAEALLEAARWQEFFDWGRAGEQGIRPPDYAFEWRPEPERWSAGNVSFSVARLGSCTDRFALTLVAAGEGGRLRLELRWDASRLSRIDAERLAGRLATLLHHACDDPERPLDESPLDPACEHHAALVELNDSAVELTERTVHALFEEQVDRRPSCPALVCEGEVLTYAELDRRANGVAHRLRELGVGPEVVVALCAERSPELIVGLLGILKAGGAYAPLDPGMPRERLATLVAECGAPLLLTAGLLAGSLPALPRVVRCEDIPPADVRPDGGARGGNLAYVIFTSGSTGLPKGVAVEHRRLVNYVQAAAARLALSPGGRYATVSTLAADLGNTMVFPALTRGGCLHLISHQRATDPRALAEYAGRWDLDYLKIVPSHLSALIGNPWSGGLLPKAAIILGGEALGWDLVARLRAVAPSCRIFNHYGPTEATVGALAHPIGEVETTATVPIGRPLGNARVYLLDPGFLPVPREVAGELYIGGRCLARGYIGRPELTAERFIPDPFAPEAGGRLYRTGDRARLLASGSVEFLGRVDDQVKIRGYRVEPGEVASVLRAHPAVRDAAVVPHQERPGEVSLVGYVVPAEGSEGSGLKPADLRAFLLGLVPEFMVPRALVLLPSLPLTANGKLDRRRLPAPQDAAGDAQDRIAPRTPAELLLAAIWSQVLGIGEVGVRDNFFALGGDSILSIQVVSRANQAGLRLTPRQLFQHQTIAELAAVAGTSEALEPAGPLTGELPLTPIQHWFFAQELPEPQHFNQSLLLRLRPGLDPALLRPAIARLIEHHDALRLRFTRGSGGWEQVCAPPGGEPPWGWIDLRALPAERRRGGQEAAAQQLQESLDLGVRLLRAAVFEWGGAEPPRLALVVHHLAIDVVSWRILLEDLTTACRQAGQGLPIALPSRTTSYGAWAERLREEAASPARHAELATWLAIARSDFTLPAAAGAGTAGAAASVVVELSAGETRALLSEVPEVYGTQVNDVLLAALAPALARWARHDRPLLELEGHGREASGEGIDLSRTVGWFTSRYPVTLELRGLHGPEAVLKSVKEQLRRVPGRGLGFGLLRYLAADPAVADAMTALPRPQVSFNYLGQLDTALPAEALFALAAEPIGPERSPRNPRRYRLEVNVRVAGGRLQAAFVYGRDQYPEAQIAELAGSFLAELRRLIAHCADPRAGGRTPSDFPLAELDQARLDRLVGKGRHLEDVYPLSLLQQGLLFHALYHPGSYVSPMSCTLEGELDVAALRRAWQEVVDRHPILRTSFTWEGLERPLQLVHRRVELPWEELDWRQLSSGQGEQRLQALLASRLRQGFDLARAPLMSLTLARTGERSWSFLWERHHLLIDGWTTSLILNEVFRAYAAVTGGEPWAAEPPHPFRDYIAWLGAQDLAAAAEHWRRTLAGFAAPTPLPMPPEAALSAPSEEATGEVRVKLSPAESSAVEAFARQRQITLNTLFQGAWALLLAHYAGSEDVVFGGVVAGRPPALPGVDTMAGPFINTLPVRVRVPPASPLVAWLIDLQAAQAEQRQFEHSPLVEIQGWSELPRGLPLFETILVFENHPMELAAGDGSVRARDIRHAITNSYALTLRPVPMASLELHMLFDRSRIPAATATALLQRLELLLARLLAAPESSLGELSAALAAEDERHRQEQEKTYDDSLLQKFKSARRRAVSSTIGGV